MSCPCHDDGQKPSLQINNGNKHPVVCTAWGRASKEHDLEVIAHLKAHGAWPTSDALSPQESSEQAEQRRSPDERRRYALGIWKELAKLKKQRDLTPLLSNYLQQRAIKNVPTTALVTVPIAYEGIEVGSHDPGMVLAVRNKEGKFQGIHVVWLNANMTAKREAEPQRQSYGPIKGNFVHLTAMDWANPPSKLLIAEGPETALSGMQLTGLPGIASAGAGMMKDLDPPQCTEYIILADNGEAGQEGAIALARRLIDTVPAARSVLRRRNGPRVASPAMTGRRFGRGRSPWNGGTAP